MNWDLFKVVCIEADEQLGLVKNGIYPVVSVSHQFQGSEEHVTFTIWTGKEWNRLLASRFRHINSEINILT